jgi:hypothetical protein
MRTADSDLPSSPELLSSVAIAPPQPAAATASARFPCGRFNFRIAGGTTPRPVSRPTFPKTFTSAGGKFVIHYVSSGTDAPYETTNLGPDPIIAANDPSGQVLATTDPATGAPAYIQRIAFWLDLALVRYQAAGFPDPTVRYPCVDVYVWKVTDSSGHEVRGMTEWGCIDLHNTMMTTDPDMLVRRLQHTCCHELFHLVQDQLVFDSNNVQVVNFSAEGLGCWSEGLAELAPDFVNTWQNAWMDHWSLMLPTSTDPLPERSYDACLLWRYACDRFSNTSREKDGALFGSDIAKELLLLAQPGTMIDWDGLLGWLKNHPEARSQPRGGSGWAPHRPVWSRPAWAEVLPAYLRPSNPALRFLRSWSELCPAGAGFYSDWLVANIVQDFGNAASKRCFGYADRDEPPGLPQTVALYGPAEWLPLAFPVNRWCWRYFALNMAQEPGPVHLNIRTALQAGASLMRPNLQIIKTDGCRVLEITRATGDLDTVVDTSCEGPTAGFFMTPVKDVFVIFAAEDAGVAYSITVSTTAVLGWGDDRYGQTDAPPDASGATKIAAGGSHSLALKADGTVVAWGDNSEGQIDVPPGQSGVTAIAAGSLHSLALAGGKVVAWGWNAHGQTNVPAGLSDVIAIAAAGGHSLALKADGTVVAWGDNSDGQIDVPPGLSGVTAIAASNLHSLALKADGTVVAWGGDEYGETDVPAGVSGVIAIAAGGHHSLALKSDGTVVAWGDHQWGQTDVPRGLANVVAISAGGGHSVALTTDGTVVAWGMNDHGQANVPPGQSGVTAIAAGSLHSLALVS